MSEEFTPIRQMVLDPSGAIWLIGVEGRVECGVTLKEVMGWGGYAYKPVAVDGVLTYKPPNEDPHWELHPKTWEQMSRLKACTCLNKKGPHWQECCLVEVASEYVPPLPF